MIRLLLIIVLFLFFVWLLTSLFLKDKKDLNKKIIFPKFHLFLGALIILILIVFILPRIGLNPLFLLQKVTPLLSYLRAFIPF